VGVNPPAAIYLTRPLVVVHGSAMGDQRRITTYKQVLSLIGDGARIASRCGVSYRIAGDWLRTGRVEREYWDNLIAGLKSVGAKGVTMATFYRIPSAAGVQTFVDLLDLFPSFTALAKDIGVPVSTVRSWSERDKVPVQHWYEVVETGKKFGIRDLTLTTMSDCIIFQRERTNGQQRSDLRSQPRLPHRPPGHGQQERQTAGQSEALRRARR
jgi:hypothetical protein